MKAKLESVYKPSDDIVAREFEGEVLIVPITAGIGDMEDELYSLSETGKAIWDLLDGKRNLAQVVEKLARRFDAAAGEIETDVLALMDELVARKLVEVC